MKCSYKMAIPTALIVFLTSLVVTIVVYGYAVSMLEDEATEDLTAYASLYMDKTERVLYNKYLDVKWLAADAHLISPNAGPERIQKKLEEFLSIHGSYESASFFNARRVRVADTAKKKIGETHKEIAYWKELKDRDFVQDVSDSESLGRYIAHFAHVVRGASGDIAGYVVLRMDMNKIVEVQKPFILKRNIEKFKVDFIKKNGSVLFSNYEKTGSVRPEWNLVNNEIAKGKKLGLIRNIEDNKERIYIYAVEEGVFDYAGNGNTLIFNFALDDVLAPAIRVRNILIAIFLASSIISVLIIYFYTGLITRPLNKLSHAALELGKGNLHAAETVDYSGRDEVGTLTGAFKQMAKNIKIQHDLIEEYNVELENSRNALIEAQRVGLYGDMRWDIAEDRIIYSDALYELFGVTSFAEREKIGYGRESFYKFVHPADLQTVKRAVKGAISEGGNLSADFRVFRIDNEQRTFSMRAEVESDNDGRPVRLIGTIQDITDRKRMAEALRESEERYRLLAENVKDAIYRYEFKPEKGFKYVSRAIGHITGYGQDEYYKDPELFFHIIHEDDRAAAQSYLAGTAMTDKPYALRIVRKDGVFVWIEMSNSPVLDSHGGLVAIEGIARDITGRVEAEQTMKKLYDDRMSAFEQVKKLSGLIPICASCKSIRSDTGYWDTIEKYVAEHSEAVFSHSICPDCVKKLYPEYADKVLGKDDTDEKE